MLKTQYSAYPLIYYKFLIQFTSTLDSYPDLNSLLVSCFQVPLHLELAERQLLCVYKIKWGSIYQSICLSTCLPASCKHGNSLEVNNSVYTFLRPELF